MAPADLAFGAAISFLVGILFASVHSDIYFVFLLVAVLGGISSFLLKENLFTKKNIAYFVMPLFLAFLYYHAYLSALAMRNDFPKEKSVFHGTVQSEPIMKEKVQEAIISVKEPRAGKIMLITGLFPELRYGDILTMDGKIDPPRRDGLPPVLFFPNVDVAGHEGSWIKEGLIRIKQRIVSGFRRILPSDSATLLSGITFGTRSGWSEELKRQMSLSGTTHIVALSGYNIAILTLAVGSVLGRSLSRRKTFFLTVLIIFLFVLMVGAEISVVRAACMGLLLLLAKEFGRLYDARNATAFAALLMVMLSPTILVFDVAFQLSFLSLLGIVYVSPVLKKLFQFKEDDANFLSWKENLVNTLGAQLAVAPVIIQAFHEFSLTSLLANILILEFIPLTMFLGFLIAALMFLSSYLAFGLAALAGILLGYELFIIRLFSHIRLPVSGPVHPFAVYVIYYAAILGLIFYYSKKHARPV